MAPGYGTKLYDPTLRFRASTIGYGKQETDGMLKKLAIGIAALSLAAGALALTSPVQAQAVKAGMLTCNVAGGFGFIFGSSKAVNCTFAPVSGVPQNYVGSMGGICADHLAGTRRSGRILWRRDRERDRRRRSRRQCAGRRHRKCDFATAAQHRRQYRPQCRGWGCRNDPHLSARVESRIRDCRLAGES